MDTNGRAALLGALPRLRGHLAGVWRWPKVSVTSGARPDGREVDLGRLATDGPAAAGIPVPAGQGPLLLSDAALDLSVSVSGADPSTGVFGGRVVAVTGAASGIGREIARVFAEAGADVVALDIAAGALEVLAGEIGCTPVVCDVTDSASVSAAFEAILLARGGLDVLVSNAGAASQGPIADVPVEDLQKSFDLNFFGHQRVCREAVRIFRAQGVGGLILFNISNQSVNPGKDFGPYGIPKAAVLALMRQYALDHGAEGIRTSGVNAGRIRTGLLNDDMINQRAAARGITPFEYLSGNLLGVEVTARDVAEAFLHLAMMDKVNAAVLTVDGGAMATAMR
jgi:NAD(P)-dependent dehydrogenase (short-subunit alcohol dehydrogenase family)